MSQVGVTGGSGASIGSVERTAGPSAPSGIGTARERVRLGLDPAALAAGAVVGLATLVAVALVSAQLDPFADEADGSGPVVGILLLVAVTGLGAAGSVAARRCRRAPLAHAAGAALAAVGMADLVVIARQVVTGDPIAWWPVVAWLLLALACGTAGGLAVLRAPRPRRGADSPL